MEEKMARHTFAAALVLIVLVTGCARQPGSMQASGPAPTGAAATGPGALGQGSASSRTATTEYTAGARPKLTGYATTADLQDIRFDFDRYDLGSEERATLDRHAAWLEAHPAAALLIEGHCDERGTTEYNLSLGERRAKATANYLSSRGVRTDRMTVISYGEERPLCKESAEECWSRNRRAHFLLKQR